MYKPSYYELSQPESFEDTPQNKQNKIRETNTKISKIRAELEEGSLKEETLSESIKKYLSDIERYESLVQKFANDNPEKEYNPYSKSLDQANINITRIQWLLQEREKKLGDIVKLESELTELKKLKNLASYHQGTQNLLF